MRLTLMTLRYTHTLFRCGKFQSQNVRGAAAELSLGSAAVAALTLDARPP